MRSGLCLSAPLIPVLVTGIQQRRVCGAGEPFEPKDVAWLARPWPVLFPTGPLCLYPALACDRMGAVPVAATAETAF
ncbi:hypothetical protein CN092_27880 [Sinorhizobium meliloti]|nr:hypothetical protein CN092_27880 [Sinorhizobium meliloti]